MPRRKHNHKKKRSSCSSNGYSPWQTHKITHLCYFLVLQVAALDSKLSQALPMEIGQKGRKLEQLEREAAEPQRSREVGFSITDAM